MITVHTIGHGEISSLLVCAQEEAAAERTVFEIIDACDGFADFGPVVPRGTGWFGAAGVCSTEEAALAVFMFSV